MSDHCAFCKEHEYSNWADYELLRYELEETNEVCHGNWIEIQHLREYINQLQELLSQHGIAIPPEY